MAGAAPFFCQVEAAETAIWLTEVASRRPQHAHLWRHLRAANEQANPELLRIALKMATGAGKTTVMAMLIAWQTVNAVRSPNSALFSRGFLIMTPGITIRDRLRSLLRPIQRVSVDSPTPRSSATDHRVRPLVSANRTASSSNALVNRLCCLIGAPCLIGNPPLFRGKSTLSLVRSAAR